MGRRNLSRYTEADWRAASGTVEQILINGWQVYADCPICELRIRADLKRIAQAAGVHFCLWGASAPCRRVGCVGRVQFVIRPRGAIGEIVMTAKALR